MKELSAEKERDTAFTLYLILAGLFIASLVSCNLIFQKFFYWQPIRVLDYTFEISVGIIPYPLTFLVTDIISEIFGKKKANQVVFVGIIASIFVFLLILIAEKVPATSWSPVDDNSFSEVFGRTGIAVIASMTAYLIAQFIDIKVFHYLKQLTKNRKLWIRNNFSTITSQLVDTSIVLILLCSVGAIEWNLFVLLFINGFLFKLFVAVLDTPLFYFFTWLVRKKFKLKLGEELKI